MGEQLIKPECCDLGCRLFGKDRPGSSGDSVVDVCYRPFDQEAEVNEDFFKQLEGVSC